MAKEMTEFNNRLDKLAEYCMNSGRFDQDLYIEYDVNVVCVTPTVKVSLPV